MDVLQIRETDIYVLTWFDERVIADYHEAAKSITCRKHVICGVGTFYPPFQNATKAYCELCTHGMADHQPSVKYHEQNRYILIEFQRLLGIKYKLQS